MARIRLLSLSVAAFAVGTAHPVLAGALSFSQTLAVDFRAATPPAVVESVASTSKLDPSELIARSGGNAGEAITDGGDRAPGDDLAAVRAGFAFAISRFHTSRLDPNPSLWIKACEGCIRTTSRPSPPRASPSRRDVAIPRPPRSWVGPWSSAAPRFAGGSTACRRSERVSHAYACMKASLPSGPPDSRGVRPLFSAGSDRGTRCISSQTRAGRRCRRHART